MKRVLPLAMAVLGGALLSGASPARSAAPAADCAALRQAYAAALEAAQACQPEAKVQCQAIRSRAPDDPCHCQASVNEARASELDALLERYRERSCPSAAGPCNRRCLTPAARCLARPGAGARCG